MASNCFTPIRGRRMRITRVNSLGRWVPGPCSQVVTSGFVTVEMTAEIEEGETTTVRTAGGDVCVSERGCDTLNWYNISIEFCQVDPELFSMINPTWTKLLDYNGETIGWEESHDYSCDAGFALEVWSDVSGYTPTDPNAEGAWVYYLLPFIVGGTVGDITIENGAVTFTITGRTKRGSQWGRGPYNVMRNPPDGSCGPLITPFKPDAPRRIFLTTCPPPAVLCGCQPLSAEDGPIVTAFEDTTDVTRMTVKALASGVGPFTVDWGDGTVEDMPAGLTGKTHRYGRAGSFNIAVYPTGDPSKATFTPVTVPATGTPQPQPLLIDVSEDTTDATRRTAKVEWDNSTFGTVTLNWGDGTPPVTAQAATGDATHQYAQAGSYPVTITDESDASRTANRTVIVPFGLLLTVEEETADPDHRTVNVTVDNGNRGQVNINWGDGTALTANPGDGTTVSSHKYAQAGGYTVTVTDADEPARTANESITVPFAPEAPVVTVTQATSDTKKMSVNVAVDNHGNGPVIINWGDGSATSTNTGDGTALTLHKYLDEGTYNIVVTDADNSAITATRQAAVPYDGGVAMTATVVESTPPGSARRKVTLTWDNQGQGPVSILWGQPASGETPTPGPDAGSLDHEYTADGSYTITITDATNSARSITRNAVVPFTT